MSRGLGARLELSNNVREALAAGRPLVALESSLISHGLAYPANVRIAGKMEEVVRAAGAEPATVAVLEGQLRVGLTGGEIERLGTERNVFKVGRSDLAAALRSGRSGATTVAGTVIAAHAAGIRVMATGGIGGVHRGLEEVFDVSGDLATIACSPVAVISAGAKSVLDLPRTLEVLESLGVPVVGYGTDELPAFYVRQSGLPLQHRLDQPGDVAEMMELQWSLPGGGGLLIANPPPESSALSATQVEAWITEAVAGADREGVSGKAVTPYLLAALAELSGGATVEANLTFLEANARLAAAIAVAWSERMEEQIGERRT